MLILGISSGYHDSAATLLEDGQVVAATQEERFTRIKHDKSFPFQSIEFCLSKVGKKLHQLDAIVYYEKPLLKMDRMLESYLSAKQAGLTYFVETATSALLDKIFFRDHFLKELKKIDAKVSKQQLLFSEHHLSHAASAFFPSPYSEALVLCADGVGEKATTSLSLGQENQLAIQEEIHFPHSLGLFYSALTSFCGFKVNSGEYKLMGLAPYGTPRFTNLILEKLILLSKDGSFHLNLQYFNFYSTEKMFTPLLEQLFSVPPRIPESEFSDIYFDIAASTQKALNLALAHLLCHALQRYPAENLCLAGGVALNCVSNAYLLQTTGLKNIWVQPAAGDAGGSLGAAFAAYHLHFKKDRTSGNKELMKNCYLGTTYTNEDIQKYLETEGLSYQQCTTDELIAATSLSLQNGMAIGWFQGQMEFGPRALGSRSILADARAPEMHKKLNLKIKMRESFRPFAPIVLQERADEWFNMKQESSPYMLFTFQLRDSKKSQVPAITHLDSSARVQTLSHCENPLMHQLLAHFEKETQCPLLINTSFNVRGEPIVESPRDAIRCFFATDLDVLVIGSFILEKTNNPHFIKNNYPSALPLD